MGSCNVNYVLFGIFPLALLLSTDTTCYPRPVHWGGGGGSILKITIQSSTVC
jgi:hypothetical protein